MRIFFAVDGQSTIQAGGLWQQLQKRLPREYFEVLPLARDHFYHDRKNLKYLEQEAEQAALKILRHYPDVQRCVVVYRVEKASTKTAEGIVSFDFVTTLHQSGVIATELLNPVATPHPIEPQYWVSSPSMQPELTEKLVEFSGIEHIFKSRLLPR